MEDAIVIDNLNISVVIYDSELNHDIECQIEVMTSI